MPGGWSECKGAFFRPILGKLVRVGFDFLAGVEFAAGLALDVLVAEIFSVDF